MGNKGCKGKVYFLILKFHAEFYLTQRRRDAGYLQDV